MAHDLGGNQLSLPIARGLRPVQFNRELPQAGDRLAVLDALEDVAKKYPQFGLELIDTVIVRDAFPLKTGEGYYSGRTPLENQGDGRVRLNVYRVTGAQPPSPSISSGRTRWSNSSPVRNPKATHAARSDVPSACAFCATFAALS